MDVNPILTQVIELTRARWSNMPQERGVVISVNSELAPDLPKILGAENEMRDALTNLMLNAVGCDARRRRHHAAHASWIRATTK